MTEESLADYVTRLEQENKKLKEEFTNYENEIEDWVSDNSILYQYDDRCPDTLEELQCCMEETHKELGNYRKALEEIKNDCVEILATIAEEGKPAGSIIDTIWCKNIPCCTLWELVEGMQNKINEVLNDSRE